MIWSITSRSDCDPAVCAHMLAQAAVMRNSVQTSVRKRNDSQPSPFKYPEFT
jgi:hypothetical protein